MHIISAPAHESVDQGQLFDAEARFERLDRFNRSMRRHKKQRIIKKIISSEEPLSYESTTIEEVWRQAMIEEIEAIEKNLAWETVKPSEKCKPIGVKWVYRIKEFHG